MSADLVSRGFSTFLTWLAEPAGRALALGCFAAAALAILRVKRVSMRLGAWTAVLCLALAMPLLGSALPRLPLPMPASVFERISNLKAVAAVKTVTSDEWRVTSKQAIPAASGAEMSFVDRGRRPAKSPSFLADRNLRNANADAKGQNEILNSAGTRFARQDGEVQAGRSAAMSAPVAMPVMPFKLVPVVADDLAISPAQKIYAAILGVYLLIALILFARFFAGMWFSRKLERAAAEISPLYFAGGEDERNRQAREALRLLRSRSSLAGVKAAPALKESAAILVPATVGVRRPVILLPEGWRAWDAAELDAILAHEISHVARRDALTQALSLVHRAIFWFSPLAWWLDRQLTELAEQASDEAALAGGADRTRYAETLLGFFAQLSAARQRVWWQGVSMATRSSAGSAERRVEQILAWKGNISATKMRKLAVVGLAAIVAAVALAFASVHPVIASGQEAKSSEQAAMTSGQQEKAKAKSSSKNVILPGGPQTPTLPNAPKIPGVAAPATLTTPPTPASAPQSGVAAPAIASAPAAFGPPAPPLRIENSGPMPPAPRGGVVAPAMAVPSPSAANPVAGSVGVASVSGAGIGVGVLVAPSAMEAVAGSASAGGTRILSAAPAAPIPSSAPVALQSTIVVGDSTSPQEAAAQLRAAEKALQQTDMTSVSVRLQGIQEAMKALQEAQRASLGVDSAQMLAAQHALEKAQRLATQDDALQLREAKAAMQEARRDMQEAERAQESTGRVTITRGMYNMDSGPRYVMMLGNSDCDTGRCDVNMSGDQEDLDHARKLRKKISGPFIWFERDEKSYVITDPAFIAKAQALFAPEQELAKQQDELGRQQDELGRQQDALGEQMEAVKIKVPDITADLERVRARLKELQATGATQRELGRVQAQLGRLQAEVGRFQAETGVQRGGIGRKQGELGRKQGELGRRQGELGRRQGQIAREASRQLRAMLDDAIAKGIAKPE